MQVEIRKDSRIDVFQFSKTRIEVELNDLRNVESNSYELDYLGSYIIWVLPPIVSG